jgi:hypothetical protein
MIHVIFPYSAQLGIFMAFLQRATLIPTSQVHLAALVVP